MGGSRAGGGVCVCVCDRDAAVPVGCPWVPSPRRGAAGAGGCNLAPGLCPPRAGANRLLASAGGATQSALLAWPPRHRASCHAAQPSLAGGLALPARIFPWDGEAGAMGGDTSSPAPLHTPAPRRFAALVGTGVKQEPGRCPAVPRDGGTSPDPLACPQTRWHWPCAPLPTCPGPPPPSLSPPWLGPGPVPPSHQCWGIHYRPQLGPAGEAKLQGKLTPSLPGSEHRTPPRAPLPSHTGGGQTLSRDPPPHTHTLIKPRLLLR